LTFTDTLHIPAVRISPNEVSFISIETAWQDIYGFRTGNNKQQATMLKDPVWYPLPGNGVPSILMANDKDHSRGRRLLSHAFSSDAVANQEVLVQKYVDAFISRLGEIPLRDNGIVDIQEWFRWTTNDITTDLLFGKPFGCLERLETHEHMKLLKYSIESERLYYITAYFPWTKALLNLMIDQKILEGRKAFYDWVGEQTEQRLSGETQRPDFMTYWLRNSDTGGHVLSCEEIVANNGLIIVAGSDSTANTLTSATYLLLRNPSVMEKLADEIRQLWNSHDEITFNAVSKAPYLSAVVSETLRYVPPAAVGFERRVGEGGAAISGYAVPEGTAVSISAWPAYHAERNFRDPDAFVPERWLGDPQYEGDNFAGCQPFSFGPRNCVGKVPCEH